MENEFFISKSRELYDELVRELKPLSPRAFIVFFLSSYEGYHDKLTNQLASKESSSPDKATMGVNDFGVCFAVAYARGIKKPSVENGTKICNLIAHWSFYTFMANSGFYKYVKEINQTDKGVEMPPDTAFSEDLSKFKDYFLSHIRAMKAESKNIYGLIEHACEATLPYVKEIQEEARVNPIVLFYLIIRLSELNFEGVTKDEFDRNPKMVVIRVPEVKIINAVPEKFQGTGKELARQELKNAMLYLKLSPEIAEMCILDRMRLADRPEGIWSYPLWDHPLIEHQGVIYSNVKLFADAIPELEYKVIRNSKKALSLFKLKAHDDLIGKVKGILEAKGFVHVGTKKVFKNSQDRKIAEFDLVMKRGNIYYNIEIKTVTNPFYQRVYGPFSGLEKEANDFLKENNLLGEKWKNKVALFKGMFSGTAMIKNIVVTDIPHPAALFSEDPKIVWVGDLDNAVS